MNIVSEVDQIAKSQGLEAAYRIAEQAVGRAGYERFLLHKGRQSCIKKAMSKPLPGASGDTFIKGNTTVGDVTVREVLPIHIACLQAVESPLLTLVNNAIQSEEKKAAIDFNEQQQFEICYLFTTEPKQLRKTLKESGAESIKKLSDETVCDWTAAKINMVILAVVEQFHRHIQTSAKFAAQVEAQGDEHFFRALSQKN